MVFGFLCVKKGPFCYWNCRSCLHFCSNHSNAKITDFNDFPCPFPECTRHSGPFWTKTGFWPQHTASELPLQALVTSRSHVQELLCFRNGFRILWILHFSHFCRLTNSVLCTLTGLHHTKVRMMQASDSRTSQVDLLAARLREILVVHDVSKLSNVQKSVLAFLHFLNKFLWHFPLPF